MPPKTTDTPQFGQRILELRRAKHWLQGDLIKALAARKVDIDVSYLSKIENNRLAPASKVILALAAVLDANAEELLDLAGRYDPQALQDVAKDIPEAATLLRRISRRQVSPEQIRTFLRSTEPKKDGDADKK
jgi:transcriptional regulator with XRE-family HTH domain